MNAMQRSAALLHCASKRQPNGIHQCELKTITRISVVFAIVASVRMRAMSKQLKQRKCETSQAVNKRNGKALKWT